MSEDRPLDFLEWRRHLCPQSKSWLACFACEHYLGNRTDEPWPDFCDIFTGDLWRNYVLAASRKAEAVA